MSNNKFIKYKEALKKATENDIPEERFIEAMMKGEIKPLIKHPETGMLTRVSIQNIDEETGNIDVIFLNDSIL
jgi:hypothetical protein